MPMHGAGDIGWGGVGVRRIFGGKRRVDGKELNGREVVEFPDMLQRRRRLTSSGLSCLS